MRSQETSHSDGIAVYRLGGTKDDAKDWSTKFNSNDSEADQKAIKNGWLYRNDPKK